MIKTGVIGAGHLGKIHLRQIQEVPALQLVGFYDANPDTAQKVAAELGVTPFERLEDLIQAVDAVDIVTPTLTHYDIAKKAIQQSRHVFIEKPLTQTPEEAQQLVKLVEEAGVVAQVGHVERFNPAFLAAQKHNLAPLFIEIHRLAQWNPRGTDVSVVLDLMIHDIDIVQHIVKSGVRKVFANGVAVVSSTPDIANARIEFNNGCVANLTASRISLKNMRRMRIFQRNAYLTVDFLEKKTEVYMIGEEGQTLPGYPAASFAIEGAQKTLYIDTPPVPEVNAIRSELASFAEAIQKRQEPPVTVHDAYTALTIAHEIMSKIMPA